MILSTFDLQHINFWNNFTYNEDDKVYDMISLNYGSQRLVLNFKFERHKNFCYCDTFNDYVIKYSKSLEYIELINQLSYQLPYLHHIYERDAEITYG